MVETTDTPVDAYGRSIAEYKYCLECEEEVEPVIVDFDALCPYCDGETIYKPLYRYEVTRHIWKYCTVLAGDTEEAKDLAEEDGEWEESPDYDETVNELNLGAH